MISQDGLVGRHIAGYLIERPLGRGGMAQVYYAWDTRLHRPAAIKVIDERYRGNPSYTARFVREARLAATLKHPNILPIYYSGDEEGVTFFAMEYIEGLDLSNLLRQYTNNGERIPVQDAMQVGKAIASALDYAHQKGVIHRDVKPSNVLISTEGRIYLADFGIALSMDQGTIGEVFGSPQYIAPEQARSSSAAVPQSDLYSLGVMLYEMLSGRLPFDDPSPATLALKHLSQEPPSPRLYNPGLSQGVEAVLLRALSKDPHKRYQTGKELINELQKAFSGGRSPVVLPETAPFLPATAGGLTQATLTRIHQVAPPVDVTPPTIGEEIPWQPNPPVYSPRADMVIQRSPQPRKKGLGCWGVGCISLILLALVTSAVGAYWGVNNRDRFLSALAFAGLGTPAFTDAPVTNRTRTPDITNTPTRTFPPPTYTPAATLTPTQPPTFTPTSTSLPGYDLAIFTNKDESLILVNVGDQAFPPEPLRLRGGKGVLDGWEWQVNMLQKDECVSVWKDTGKPKWPSGVKCQLVGRKPSRPGDERFWKDNYEVYYNGQKVSTCQPGNWCKVHINR